MTEVTMFQSKGVKPPQTIEQHKCFDIVLYIFCVYKLIQTIKTWLSSTVNIVPPIANEILLVKHCSIRT